MEDNRFIKASLGFIVLVIAVVILKLAKPVFFPFFLALFISYIIGPVQEFLTRRKIPKPVALAAIVLATFAILFLLGALFYSNGKAFATKIPEYGRQLESLLAKMEASRFLGIHWSLPDLLAKINTERVASIALSVFGPFFSFASTIFLVGVFLVFIMAGRGRMHAKIQKAFNPEQAKRIGGILQKIDRQVQKYLVIKTIFSAVNGLIVGLVLALFGVQFAVVFGFLAFLLNYIPNIGSTVATAIPLVIAFIQYGSIWKCVSILAIVVVQDNLMGNFVEPRFMGKGLGLSPLVLIFFLIFWGWLWGIPGMMLSVPIAAIIKIVCSNIPSLAFVSALMSK